ncbi:hypothetical protein B4U79_06421 [Dinothrombium tinctorium]|uniref:Striatin-interacting protein 1-like protein n=1 Tax=Dinothrombium tinctorium TaxID=1965070 RepID=A0A3S3P4A0_9ACAR|nr:hypothetical protein B4U79_00879 [Dinothrombium tinctorium]RWS07744.1 hypothetical protein B4U79_06421 [Dinothrombium tinctorium]
MANSNWSFNPENIDLDFVYSDADVHANEIAELYSYTEENEFLGNRTAFEEIVEDLRFPLRWTDMSDGQKRRTIDRLIDFCELSSKPLRMKGVRALLYLLQGTFGECSTLKEQAIIARENVFLLYRKGVFPLFVQLLCMEIDQSLASNATVKRPVVSLGDSFDFRCILNALYTFVEVIYNAEDTDTEEHTMLRQQLREELSQPMPTSGELLAITLFQMTTKFCNGSAPHFPIKKVLLLLWKVLLVSLGGTDTLKALKNLYRANAGLPPAPDDTIEVTKTMRAASPPANAAEVLEAQQQRKMVRPFKRQMVIKQSSVMGDDSSFQDMDGNVDANGDEDPFQQDVDREMRNNASAEEKMDIGPRPASPRPATPTTNDNLNGDQPIHSQMNMFNKGLPWIPKVRQKDIDAYLDGIRMKFVGYVLPNDRSTTAGLPSPILEGIKILQQHLYISLSELQMKREEEISKYPLTTKELDETPLSSPAETLYQAMLQSLPQYMIALLKILLAAAPTSKAKTESINIMSDVLPEEMPMSVLQSMKLGIDVNRHKEIIIKSVSAILLLLLKHYKINHIYQFEYISQQLMFANCIPLVLKFFNQNIYQYITSKNTISVIDFPACVIGEQPELTTETLEIGDTQPYCWRNMFSCINLVRILNKLTKWKHSRIMMLVVFKSAPILKRALKVRHSMLQLYFLKLLKMQAKYLGRQWRKSNMKTMSAIYQKVRHRLTDDWAFGNDLDSRPWDFQAEEFTLQANINRFHHRRYEKSPQAPPPPMSSSTSFSISGQPLAVDIDLFNPVDNNLLSVLSKDIGLTNEFKYHYETWLEREVFQINVDWDQLLTSTDSSDM